MTDRLKILWLWGLVIGLLLVLAGVWRLIQWIHPLVPRPAQTQIVVAPAPTSMPTSTPAPTTATVPSPTWIPMPPEESPVATLNDAKLPEGIKLIIPVQGIKPEQLRDTFSDARSAGRVHNAIDIMAPLDTPVLATADGEIARLFVSELGGTTLYQLSKDRKVVFYYAHLDHYADGLFVGKMVRQGEVIAYVGNTGNAGEGNFHLHFAVWLTDDPKRFWNGINLNPYSLLKESQSTGK